MRSLVLDELRPGQLEALRTYLGNCCTPSGLAGVYWLNLPQHILSELQKSHTGCAPHGVAVILEGLSLRVEFLVRGLHSLRCLCTGYADSGQREYLLNFVDRMICELELAT